MLGRAIVVLVSLSLFAPSGAAAAPCWQAPVTGVVTDPFREPSCPYCAGNRGIEYRVSPGSRVVAVAAGEVTWSGAVAGTRYVVVRHVNGWLATYGRLGSTAVRTGDRVARGMTVGVTGRDFYFGLRIDGRYRDPAPFIGEFVGRPRLVPVDGSRPRSAPPPRLRCGA